MMIQQIGTALAVFTALELMFFIGLYHLTTRWWEKETGRSIMALAASLAAVLSLAILRLFIEDSPVFAWTRTIVFAAVPIAVAGLIFSLIRARRRAHVEASRQRTLD